MYETSPHCYLLPNVLYNLRMNFKKTDCPPFPIINLANSNEIIHLLQNRNIDENLLMLIFKCSQNSLYIILMMKSKDFENLGCMFVYRESKKCKFNDFFLS